MKYQLSKKDCYKAYLLHIKPRKIYAILGIVMLCLCSITMFRNNAGWYRFFGPLCVIYVLLAIYILPYYRIKKAYKQTKGAGGEIDISLMEENSFVLLTDKSNSRIPFKNIYKLKSNKHYLLIYLNQYFYEILPKKDSELKEMAKRIEDSFIKNSR